MLEESLLYYILVVPASVPVIILLTYFSWLGWQMFTNN